MGLLVWHNFQKGDATIVHDYSTNKKHSTSATAITIVAGSLGNAGRFNGTTSQVNFGDVADASGTDIITILWRGKFDVVNVLQGVIFNNGEYAIKLLATGKIEFTVWTTGAAGGPKILQSITVLSATTLYNIVCRYNGVTMKIYLNGTEDATAAQTGDLATAANNLLLGSDGTNFFDGDMEISIIRNDALGDGTGGTLNEIGAWGTNPHGLQYKHYDTHSLETGDLISEGQYDAAGGKNMVVTFKEDTKIVRAIPISGKINFSQTPIHRGNIFDTARQALTEARIVSGSPQIAFYKDVETFTLPAEFIKINKDGITENGSKYALLAGRPGGQTWIGGTGVTDKAIIRATSGVGSDGSDVIIQVGNNGANESLRARSAFIETPSYVNSGAIGNRTSLITVTSNLADPDTSTLVDGANPQPTTPWFVIGAVAVADMYIKFDFGSGIKKLITEAKWYQSNTATQGVWQWQGSDNDVDWTSIGATFTLGGATTQTQTTLSGNTTNYRYYRMLGISGTGSASPVCNEIEFQIANDTPVGAGNVGFQNTTPSAKIHLGAGTTAQNTAPLKFTSGSLLSAPEPGAIEFLTNNLYFTGINGTREIILGEIDPAIKGDVVISALNTRASVSIGTALVAAIRLNVLGAGGGSIGTTVANFVNGSNAVKIGGNFTETGAWTALYSFAHAPLNGYNLYLDSAVRNVSIGKFGFGVTSPTAVIHLKAGTAAAGTAPIKLSAGTLNTAVELGAIEFTDDGTTGKLYIVVNVAGVLTRKEIAFV